MLVYWTIWQKVKHQLLGDWTCSARNARYLTGGKITLENLIHQDYYLQFQPSKKTWNDRRIRKRQLYSKPWSRNFTKYSVDHAAFIEAWRSIIIMTIQKFTINPLNLADANQLHKFISDIEHLKYYFSKNTFR
jgi:hypothetical protein